MKPIFIFLFLFFSTGLFAQNETYSIGGRINVYNPKGRIYVFLCNSESFVTPFAGIDTIDFWVDFNKTEVEYEFKNIPSGQYAVSCYQDVNGNHKLDKWLFGPTEPWGFTYSGDLKFPPEFNDVSFDLNYDMRMNITLGK